MTELYSVDDSQIRRPPKIGGQFEIRNILSVKREIQTLTLISQIEKDHPGVDPEQGRCLASRTLIMQGSPSLSSNCSAVFAKGNSYSNESVSITNGACETTRRSVG